jgi:hypothetical protein
MACSRLRNYPRYEERYYLKRHMKGENNLLFGLTNDAFGYILTKVDFNSFARYEYVSRTSLGENTGEILIENSLKLIEDSPRAGSSEQTRMSVVTRRCQCSRLEN